MNKNKIFEKFEGFFIEDLKLNQEATLTKTITKNDINTFANVTGDHNPVHMDEEYAKKNNI